MRPRTFKQEVFIEEYCLTGNAAKAATKAGYSSNVAKQRGYKLKEQFSKEIEERTKKMLQDSVPGALSNLKTLSTEAISEAVKLGAIKDILDRAGYKPAERVEQTITHADKTTDELKRELEALTGSSDPEKVPELVN
jgi:phage terminase small subunit|tara:strand:- start:230 stop:640 length:411 start_codon:yes stop_codon:yes gene_type:complete